MASNGILFEAFSWLPAKSLSRFKIVSKSAASFPLESFFMMKQSKHMQFLDDGGFFIQPSYCYDTVKLHSFTAGQKGSCFSFGVPDSSLHFLRESAKILNSNNGLLVCKSIKEQGKGLFLCNPATQTWVSIPNPPESCYEDSYAMGVHIIFDHDHTVFPNDYEVIMVEPEKEWSSYSKCSIYSGKEQAWKEMGRFETGGRNILWDMPVYCNGVLYFVLDCFPSFVKGSPFHKPYIVSYNMEKGTSMLVRLPKEAQRGSIDPSCDMRIFRWGKVGSSLCLIRLRRSVFMGWVYDKGTWTRILKIRVRAMGVVETKPIVCGFMVMNGDSLVFATEEKVYLYGLVLGGPPRSGGPFEVVRDHGFRSSRDLCLVAYSNTLRPCGSRAAPLSSLCC